METREHNPTITPPTPNQSSDVTATTPGTLKVIRRNGSVAPYDDNKIAVAMTKAFLAVEGGQAAASARIHEKVENLTRNISEVLNRRMPDGGTIHIEYIQDQVELALMRTGEHKVARDYILYREQRNQQRKAQPDVHKDENDNILHITLDDGHRVPLDLNRLRTAINEACTDLTEVDGQIILDEALKNLFDGASQDDVNKALIMTARTMIEQEPNYNFVTARLLLDQLRQEALSHLGMQADVTFNNMLALYPEYFKHYIQYGVDQKQLSPELQSFDLDLLANALDGKKELQFTYLSIQTLYDRYFLHREGQRYELPQAFFMRVAMGLALNETDKNEKAIEFYQLLSDFDFMSSTPTLFNAGTLRPQLSSCFLTTVPDDLAGIYDAIRDNALLSKFAGGLGNDWTQVRAMGAHIEGTNGKSQGVVPFLKVANDTAVAVNQGGKRKGAVCGYLETWHLDVEEFLDLRKNTGDDRRRTHDMNTANWIPDLFMKRLHENKDWTLFSPDEALELHDLMGLEFEAAYEALELKADNGEIKNFKRMPAKSLWRKMLTLLFETGHPWVTFKDPCNLRSPQQHVGVVHSSNLCTEITLNTSQDEVAVCNLGSINLANHMVNGKLDEAKLKRTTKIAIRMLDNVVDINYYTIPQAKNSNLKHRPIGLGLMGFQDALYQMRIPYASNQAVEFADKSMEMISYYALEASAELAQERGSYDSFEGSLWQQGILPIDSITLLAKARGKYLEQDTSTQMDWTKLRKLVSKGMRNSNVMAIAPTATIANICGVSASIEPTYQNLYVKSNMSGEFTIANPYLVAELKQKGLWDQVMINDLKYFDGSVQKISRIPEEIKARFATAFEVEAKWLVEAGSRRQKWLDQSQSLNLYVSTPSGKVLDGLYKLAWLRGLKTTYYLRTLGATGTEKATINDSTLNAVQACSIDDPDCEACQ